MPKAIAQNTLKLFAMAGQSIQVCRRSMVPADPAVGRPQGVDWDCRKVRGYIPRQPHSHPLGGGTQHNSTGAIAMIFSADIPNGLTNEDAILFNQTYFRVAHLRTISPDGTPLYGEFQLMEWQDNLSEHSRQPRS